MTARTASPDFHSPTGHGRLLIAAGMQRSGTRWFCNMLVDIVGEVEGRNSRDLRREYELEDLLQSYLTPTFNKKLTARRLRRLEPILHDGCTLVFKTHRPPTPAIRKLLDSGAAAAVYLYRDPREVVISALQQGIKARARGALPFRNFARLTSFNRAKRWLQRRLLPVWQEWTSLQPVLPIRYEELQADTPGSLKKVLDHFRLDAPDEVITRIVRSYAADNVRDDAVKRALDLDRENHDPSPVTLTCAQLAELDRILSSVLPKMGYPTT